MTKKKWNAAIAVLGLVCVSAAAYVYQRDGSSGGKGEAASGASAAKPGSGPATGAGPSAPQAVEVATVGTMKLQDEVQAVGSLTSRQGVMLRPEASGRVAKLGFADGQRVKRGQLLLQLDDTLQRAQVQQAQAQASIARTTLQRNRDLAAQNFVSQSSVDQAQAALQVAEAQVALAQAQLVRMRVLAPFNGVVGIRMVNVGDYVKDGAEVVNIEDVQGMFVDFRLPESVLARLKVGQAVEVSLDGLPGRSFTGRVEAFDAQLDANGRSLLVRASLPNSEGVLRSGMFARTRLVMGTRDQAVVVPEEALVPQGGRQHLVKVVDGPKGLVSQRVEAKLGLRVPGKVEILEGLAAGDVVVVAGQARLMRADDLPVKVVQVGAQLSAAATAASAPARAASR